VGILALQGGEDVKSPEDIAKRTTETNPLEYHILNLSSGEHLEILGDGYQEFFDHPEDEPHDLERITIQGECTDGFGNRRKISWEYDAETIFDQMRGSTGLF
jgi:hypothetical protein